MDERIAETNRRLIAFWDGAFTQTEEEKEQARQLGAELWRDLAPSEKLFRAACALGSCRRVLDYGCGSGWAAIAAAKSGCPEVTAADPAPAAVEAARFYAALCGAEDRMRAVPAGPGWLSTVPAGSYDGFFCSNVLDVVPPETAEEILREAARIVSGDAQLVVGLNYWLSPEAAVQRGLELTEGNRLVLNGVLRLVSRTDEEWAALFSRFFTVESLEHFAWPGETAETRRLFRLKPRI